MEVKVIETFKTEDGRSLALLEKVEDSPEKYIVALGWRPLTRDWARGFYSHDIVEAMEDFVRIARQTRVDTETVLEQIGERIEALNASLEEYSLDCLFDKQLGKIVDDMAQAADRLSFDLAKAKSCFKAMKAAFEENE